MKDSNTSHDHSYEAALAKAVLDDRRKERRWRNVRFFLGMFLILLFLYLIFVPRTQSDIGLDKDYVSLVQMNGEIMPDSNLSANRIIPLLNQAFADKRAKGVVLLINSPGGSAVQASMIHDKILQLKDKYRKKVVVVGEDSLASGAYLIATAADKIYVNDNTLTGSIGVIFSSFGLNDAIQKLGITRRVITAGDHKDRLDPFLPVDQQDIDKLKRILDMVHKNFINDVMQGRKGRIHGDANELFSGDFWLGQEAYQFGLVDGTGNLWDVLKSEFGVEYYKNYGVKPTFIEALLKNVNTELHLGLSNHGSGLQELLSSQ